MDGPIVQWKSGRVDGVASECTPDGRLPDAQKGDQKETGQVNYNLLIKTWLFIYVRFYSFFVYNISAVFCTGRFVIKIRFF